MKNLILKIFLKLLNHPQIIDRIQSKITEKKINTNIKQISIGEKSSLYEESYVLNMRNDSNLIKIGTNTHIRGELVIFASGGKITIGDYCFVGIGTKIWSQEEITIGNNVLIAHNVNIHDTNSHPIDYLERREDYKQIITTGFPKENKTIAAKKIIIEDDAWIGHNCIILKGITIGKGAIIAAGSVVTQDVEPFTIIAGNPATFVKKIDFIDIN